MPEGWERDSKYSNVWAWHSFLADLFTAMDRKAAFLAVGGLPDPADIEQLVPPELFLPLRTLAAGFENTSVASTVPTIAVGRDSIERYQAILQSDVFTRYVHAESALEEISYDIPSALNGVLQTAQSLVRINPHVLALRRSGIAVLTVTPKLIDAAFGKLPGALADFGAKLGITYLDERRRIVIYDFQKLMFESTLRHVMDMLRRADPVELERRLESRGA